MRCRHCRRGSEHLDLKNAVHIGHSTGGGEATHYVTRHGQRQGRVAKLVLIGAKPIPGVIQNWWRQAMIGSAKAHYDGIKAFSETDFTEDLKIINVPRLVMHGDDDQIVPIADSALLSAKLQKKGTLKAHEKFPHGMCTTHADTVNRNCSPLSQDNPDARSLAEKGEIG